MSRQTNGIIFLHGMEGVAGIEPAWLAWKARGYSRRWLIIFDIAPTFLAGERGRSTPSSFRGCLDTGTKV
jgi:hypothetical protein